MRSVECEMNFISKNIDHVNIITTYDFFDTRDNLFIVMEYMPGGMLYDILANEGQFSENI
jgi:serine/threonine-protein kinase HSL1, negative regulator of Swe1 kinase